VSQYIDEKQEFVYVRQTETQLDELDENLITQIQEAGYYTERKFSIKGRKILCDGKIMCHLIALSTAYKLKSVPFPRVTRIIFDEFINENGTYIKNEVEK